jgi:hypothetical protein
MLGLPGSALLAGFVGFRMVGKVLAPSLDASLATDPEQIRWAVTLTVLVPMVVYLMGGWLTELWRRRYAPRCPACQFEFTLRAAQVAQTRCCCHCGVSVDDPTAEEPAVMGPTRAELGRRLKRLNEQFAKALGYAFLPLCLPGIWLLLSVVLPPGPWRATDSRLACLTCAAFSGFALAVWFAGRQRKELSRSLGLDCPACGIPLSFAMSRVIATGTCPKCKRLILPT